MRSQVDASRRRGAPRLRTRRVRPAVAGLCVAALALSLAACGKKAAPLPRLTIAYSNDLRGEIRSCGCAAHDLGGLGRRATFLSELRDTTGDMVLVDAGDFFSSSINYGVEKADLTLKSMALMHYDAVVPGENDLGFGLDFFVRRTREADLPVLACNMFSASDSLIFPASRVVTMPSGLKVGLVGVLSPGLPLPPQVKPGTVVVKPPTPLVQAAVDAIRPHCDVVIVVAHMPRGEAQRMAQALHGVDVVVHGHDGRPMRLVRRFGEPFLLEVAARGLYMGVAYAYLGQDKRVTALQNVSVPLDKAYEDDEGVAKLFAAYDLDIATKEKASLPTGMTESRAHLKEPFVGASTCRGCHPAVAAQWDGTKHAHAFDVLTREKRTYDRDCTPCHTTGFYKKGGFENIVATPKLVDVQCEACHGNGHSHAQDPSVHTGAVAHEACTGCHTPEQSPDFDFAVFWPRIQHPAETPLRHPKAR